MPKARHVGLAALAVLFAVLFAVMVWAMRQAVDYLTRPCLASGYVDVQFISMIMWVTVVGLLLAFVVSFIVLAIEASLH